MGLVKDSNIIEAVRQLEVNGTEAELDSEWDNMS